MGLLIWLSSFAVVLFGWGVFCHFLAPSPWIREQNFWKQLIPLSLWQLCTSSSFNSDSTQSQRQNLFRWAIRRIFLILPLFLLAFVHLNFNSHILLLAAVLVWIFAKWLPVLKKRSLLLLGLGLTLWSLEASLRQVNLVFANIESYPFLYTLMDNSLTSILFGLLLGFFLVAISSISGASLFFSVIGLLSGFLSLPVAFAIFTGEILYHTWKDETKKFHCPKLSIGLELLTLLLSIGLWSLLPYLWDQAYTPQVRRFQFLAGVGLWLVMNLGIRSMVYHFKAQGLEK